MKLKSFVTKLKVFGMQRKTFVWNRSGNKPATAFVIEAMKGAATAFATIGTTPKTKFDQMGQTPGVKVTYRVTAENTFHEIVAVLRDLCPADRWNAEKRWTKKEPSWKPDELDTIIIDSFETPIPRPSENEKQKKFYSGKKKDHTIKTQVATDCGTSIVWERVCFL